MQKFFSSPVLRRLAIVTSYFVFIVVLDSYMHGVVYTRGLQGEALPDGLFSAPFWKNSADWGRPFFQWLFHPAPDGSIPRYRIFQKIFEIGLLVWVIFLTNWRCGVGLLAAHFCVAYDFAYCIILGEIPLIRPVQNPSYLMNWYQIGHYTARFDYLHYLFAFCLGVGFAAAGALWPDRPRSAEQSV